MSFAQAGFPIKPVCVRVQENVQRAGEWGAGGALSDVDTVISVCIRSHTLVCSPACNRWMNGKRGMGGWGWMLFYLLDGSLFPEL